MKPTRSAIPTTYRDTNFRSRLEARWAAFFDLVGWRWTYEPIDADGYIPDFLIHGDDPFFVEVGPCVVGADYRAKAKKPAARAEVLGRDVLVVGVSPLAGLAGFPGNPAAGVLGEYSPGGGDVDHDESLLIWATGLWGQCFSCRKIGVVHSEQSYHLRPCGHHQSGSFGDEVNGLFLNSAWSRAGNDTQWLPESVGSILRRLVS